MRGGAEIFMKRISSFQEVCIILNVKGFDKNIFLFFRDSVSSAPFIKTEHRENVDVKHNKK